MLFRSFRLKLRADNADQRLTAIGREAGVVGDERAAQLDAKQAAMARGHASLQGFALPNSEWAERGFGVKSNGELRSAATMLTVPNAQLADIEAAMEAARKKIASVQASCDATLGQVERRRHDGHMEAHAVEVALKVLRGD